MNPRVGEGTFPLVAACAALGLCLFSGLWLAHSFSEPGARLILPPQVSSMPAVASSTGSDTATPEEDEPKWEPFPVDTEAQELLMDQELIRYAGSRRFSKAGQAERVRMLERWCQASLPEHFKAMSVERRKNFLTDVESGLDDLLVERDMKV